MTAKILICYILLIEIFTRECGEGKKAQFHRSFIKMRGKAKGFKQFLSTTIRVQRSLNTALA